MLRNPFVFVYKLIGKGFALLLLSFVTIFSYVFNALFFCYRMLAVTFAVVGTIMIVADSFIYGFTAESGMELMVVAGAVVLRYLLALVNPVLQNLQETLSDYIYEPIDIRPPVRYTI